MLLKASPSLEGFNAAINAQRGSPTWRQASCGRWSTEMGFSRISLESLGKVSHHFMVISLDFLMIFMVIETLVKSREIGGFSEG